MQGSGEQGAGSREQGEKFIPQNKVGGLLLTSKELGNKKKKL